MQIFPAIDLKDGACVRLTQGDMNQATAYHSEPSQQAKIFEDAGLKQLHIVDLNGAIDGHPVNKEAVLSILDNVNIPLQLGGGIRTLTQIEEWLSIGVNRVILGTIAVRDPELVHEACHEFPERIVVGLDARGEQVAVSGWVEQTELSIFEMAERFQDAGAASIIYTDIQRDGMGTGVNLTLTKKLAQSTRLPVIASGGIGSLDDLRAVQSLASDGVKGVIIGRAYYEGKVSLTELKTLQD